MEFTRNIRQSKMHDQEPKLESTVYQAQMLAIVNQHNCWVTLVNKIYYISACVTITKETVVFNVAPSTSGYLASNDKQSGSIKTGSKRQSWWHVFVKCLFRISAGNQLYWDIYPGLSQFVQKHKLNLTFGNGKFFRNICKSKLATTSWSGVKELQFWSRF